MFRGLFRVGPNGFNVAYGNYYNSEIINKNHLDYISNLIKDICFECCNFLTDFTPDIIEPNDFIYLDPPYAPETKTSFVSYTKNGFTLDNHISLFNMILRLC